MRAAMDDAVPHRVDLRSGVDGTRLPITRGAQQLPDKLLARGTWQFFLEGDPLRVLHNDRCGVSAPFDLSLPQRNGGMIWEGPSNFVQAGFLAAGSRVEYENFHRWLDRFGF